MKGFTRDHKFVPMTDYKKVTRKSRTEDKTEGIKIERKARTVTIPKLHRVEQQEDGKVKFWAESSDGIIASLVDGSFPEEMEVRITTPEDSFAVVGHRSIMDKWSFDEFKNFADKHLERHKIFTRKKSEPFQVGDRRPEGLGDEDVIDALQSKKRTYDL